MKNISILFILVTCLFFFGCEKYLDKSPYLGITEQEVFSNFQSVRGYLDNCYDMLVDIHGWNSQNLQRTSINALSDEAGSLYLNDLNQSLNLGNWLNNPEMGEVGWAGETGQSGNIIAKSLAALRITNKVISQARKIKGLSQYQVDGLLGQAYFLRSWYYFQIIIRWGGMPIFDKAFNPTDDMDLPRLTYHESSKWLIASLDSAISLLPDSWPDAEVGRATKVAAMALKGMAELYDASPLMQNNLTTIVNNGYDIERCKSAAEYANDVLKYIAGHSNLGYRLMNKEEYKYIFYSEPNMVSPESLWYRMDAGDRNQRRGLRCNYIPQRLSGGSGNDAASFSFPTQNIVDKFQVINNGNAYYFNDSRSGYDPQHPFENRDPRFYNDIIVPGEAWGFDKKGHQLYMESYVGGEDYDLVKTNRHVRRREASEYVCKKYIWQEANDFQDEYEKYHVNTIYIRVSQIYLDYAEAMNEAYGPNSDPQNYGLTAVQAINVIRNRVGMPDVLSELTTDKTTFREQIRNERAVELFWENHRWEDLRRWMIATDVFSKPIQGITATPPDNHKKVKDKSTLEFTYKVVNINTEQRVFSTRNYWYPVAEDDALNLKNFVQNPGW